MERVPYHKQLPIAETSNGRLERQYGFRRAHSMIDTINMVVNLAKGSLNSDGFCAVLALDFKSIFNIAN